MTLQNDSHLRDLISLRGVCSQIPRDYFSVCVARKHLRRFLQIEILFRAHHIPAGGNGRGAERDPTDGLGGDAGLRGLNAVAADLERSVDAGSRYVAVPGG